jgi:putative membrane protein
MAAALVFGGELGEAYLGTQGDVFDAQKDILAATIGAIICMTVTALVRRKFKNRKSKNLNADEVAA